MAGASIERWRTTVAELAATWRSGASKASLVAVGLSFGSFYGVIAITLIRSVLRQPFDYHWVQLGLGFGAVVVGPVLVSRSLD